MRLIRLLKKDLARECKDWVQDNVISEQQALAICERYGVDFHKTSEQSMGYAVLIGLGYLFIGLAVITLVSANWEDIPRGLRMSSLILLTMATHGLALWQHTKNKHNMATGLFFLGSLFYGASIMLIAQIYHIDEHFPNGILWWALGVLPFALLLKSSLLMTLSFTLAFIWFFVEAELHYFPAVFPVFLLALAWHVFKVKESYVLFLALIVGIGFYLVFALAWYMSGEYDYYFNVENFAVSIGYFLVLHGLSKWLIVQSEVRLKDYGIILGLWVLRFAIVFMLVFSFEVMWDELLEAEWTYIKLVSVMIVGLPLIAIALSFLGDRKIYSTIAFSVLYVLAMTLVIRQNSDLYAIFFQVVTNILLVATGIWLIIKGIQENVTHYFFLGVSSILLTGLLRYIDLVGDYIGASILFIIFAVILLSSARFWKTQRNAREAIK